MEWITPQLILSSLINVSTIVYVIASMATRLSFLENRVEREMKEIKEEIHEFRTLHKEMATIQTELKNVNQTLLRFEQYIKGA